jgi:ATP-binding cassette subfamily C protein
MKQSKLKIIGRLLAMAAPMWGWMVLSVLLGTAGFLCAIAIPVLGASYLLQPASWMFWAMGLAALARGILRYGEQASNHYIAFKLLARIRDVVFGKLRQLGPARLDTQDKGNLISLITSDVELLEVFFAHTISPVAIAIVTCAILCIGLGMIHPLLGWAALACYGLEGAVLPLLIGRWSLDLGSEYRKKAGSLSALILENVRGIQEIRQFHALSARLKKTEAMTKSLADTEIQLKSFQGLTSAISGLWIPLSSLAMAWLALMLGCTPAQAVFVFVVMVSSYGPVLALANLGTGLAQTMGAAGRVLDLLDEEPVVQEVLEGTKGKLEPLSLDNVSFQYDQKPVLENVNLDIAPGEVLGLQGQSGSGKSTILKLLMRFWDPQTGQVRADGLNLREMNTSSLRSQESYVTQDTVLFHDTIAANLRIAKADATQEELEQACVMAGIDELIRTLPQGYETMVSELGSSLSAGERQRLGLARAFLNPKGILLLDEPTSNLDSLNEGIVLESVRAQKGKRTIVLVSHRASTLKFADRVLKMEDLNGQAGV